MDAFIKQTATDYDMDYEDVEHLCKGQSVDTVYARLEEHLRMRNRTNNRPEPASTSE